MFCSFIEYVLSTIFQLSKIHHGIKTDMCLMQLRSVARNDSLQQINMIKVIKFILNGVVLEYLF